MYYPLDPFFLVGKTLRIQYTIGWFIRVTYYIKIGNDVFGINMN